jgi:hypothetical protein
VSTHPIYNPIFRHEFIFFFSWFCNGQLDIFRKGYIKKNEKFSFEVVSCGSKIGTVCFYILKVFLKKIENYFYYLF